jgi:hypothetical protein
MAVTATSRLGKYICKIGYLDIRHVLAYKKTSQVFVCHGKHHVAGPFTDIQQAKNKASSLILEGFKYDKHRK